MIIPFVRKPEAANPASAVTAGRPKEPAQAADPIALVGDTDPWSWLLAASLKIDLWKLARFNELMSAHRQPVQLGRMFRDPAYAFERLSLAHSTGADELKTLSLEMFEQYLELERRRRSPDGALSPFLQH